MRENDHQLKAPFQILPVLPKNYLLAKFCVNIQFMNQELRGKEKNISEQYNQLHHQEQLLSHTFTCRFSWDYCYSKMQVNKHCKVQRKDIIILSHSYNLKIVPFWHYVKHLTKPNTKDSKQNNFEKVGTN